MPLIKSKRAPKVSWFCLTKKTIVTPNSGITIVFQLILTN
ncbi:fimbrial chaperone protein [Pediococcus acidilactici]|nr:fimbrial chaperone protein [Pediococcus acidilactici]TLP98989.1 fimbrial chaperone protein [Pediococcus acidilactici]